MSRWITIALLIGVAAAALWADDPSDARSSNARIAHLSKVQKEMKGLLAKAEKLEAKGDLKGAIACYDAALRIYGTFMSNVGSGSRDVRKYRARVDGATPKSRAAIASALRWLSIHQDDDGRWDCDGFSKHDPVDDKCDGPGGALYDVGVTGLAVMAFLGDGYTDRGSKRDNPYASHVRMGLRFLIIQQDEEGCVGSRASQHFMYNHALAAAALCEAYGTTRNPRYRKPATEAVKFILKSRNPYMGWRYEPRAGDNDTSVTSWCVDVLARARAAGIEIAKPDYTAAMSGARAWLDKMTKPATGRTGYNFAGSPPARPEGLQDKFTPELSEAITAAALMARFHTGQSPKDAVVTKGIGLLLNRPPVWNPDSGQIDMYYWYWGTRALHEVGGQVWRRWETSLSRALLRSHHGPGSGSRTGSWDPLGPWARDGGRVYSTALMALTLQAYGSHRTRRK